MLTFILLLSSTIIDSGVKLDDDDDDCRFVKRITQDASTALRVPVRCEEVSFQR